MPSPHDAEDRPDWAWTLRSLRVAAELSQPAVVRELNPRLPDDERVNQGTISRAERGAAHPSETVLRTLGSLYGADIEVVEQLVADVADAVAGVRDTRLVVQRGNTLAMQQRWRRIEGEAREVRALQTGMVIGLLQTPVYAALAMQAPEDHPAIADRMRRRDAMLRHPDRSYQLVQTEGSLRVQIGSPELMAAQLDALLEILDLPNVDLRILDMRTPVPEPLTAGGFHLYDDVAVVGIELGAATFDDPEDVAYFRRVFGQYHQAATSGDQAREILRDIASGYRDLSQSG